MHRIIQLKGSTISSFQDLESQIKKVPGKPLVLEALWDGDTDGWSIYINLYTQTRKFFSKIINRATLGIISFGGDIRLFTGQVPKWPEAELAKALGQQAMGKFGVTFYFPSDNEPDDDCPTWFEKHLAIKCEDCGKLIIPTTSPYLPKEICYNCHLRRESNAKIKNDKKCQQAIRLYSWKNEEYRAIGYYSLDYFPYKKFIPHFDELVKSTVCLKEVTLQLDDLLLIQSKLEFEIEHKLKSHKSPPDKKTATFSKKNAEVAYKGKTYVFNLVHDEEVSTLIGSINLVDEAISNGELLKFYIINGLTYRDDSLLRFLKFICEGTADMDAINGRYQSILTPEDISITIDKLVDLGCLKVKGLNVSITEVGNNLL
jgi:hypothetical protein